MREHLNPQTFHGRGSRLRVHNVRCVHIILCAPLFKILDPPLIWMQIIHVQYILNTENQPLISALLITFLCSDEALLDGGEDQQPRRHGEHHIAMPTHPPSSSEAPSADQQEKQGTVAPRYKEVGYNKTLLHV